MRAFWPALGLGLCVLVGFGGCSSVRVSPSVALPPPLPAGGTLSLSKQQVDEGRRLYIAKCAGCHKFYDPARYTDADWRKWMTKMSKKTKLKPAQEEMLARYLGAFRAASDTNRSENQATR